MAYTEGPSPDYDRGRDPATPVDGCVANLQDRVDRVGTAANLLGERLALVLRPPGPELAAKASMSELRRECSPLVDQLESLDRRLVVIADQLNDLRDRLDI